MLGLTNMSNDVIVKMDDRCPRKLKTLPCSFCPLAVKRLKSLKYDGNCNDDFDEAQRPGCDYAIDSQMANYCFFKYTAELLPSGKPLSDMMVSHLLGIPLNQIRSIEAEAIRKLAEHPLFKELGASGGVFDTISSYSNPDIRVVK